RSHADRASSYCAAAACISPRAGRTAYAKPDVPRTRSARTRSSSATTCRSTAAPALFLSSASGPGSAVSFRAAGLGGPGDQLLRARRDLVHLLLTEPSPERQAHRVEAQSGGAQPAEQGERRGVLGESRGQQEIQEQ